jgi:hypothetical protein
MILVRTQCAEQEPFGVLVKADALVSTGQIEPDNVAQALVGVILGGQESRY